MGRINSLIKIDKINRILGIKDESIGGLDW
jgi:hypothetical protein